MILSRAASQEPCLGGMPTMAKAMAMVVLLAEQKERMLEMVAKLN